MAQKTPRDYKQVIQSSGKTIYDPIEIGDAEFWIPTLHLETLLNEGLRDKVLQDAKGRTLPNRTRSKVVKTYACSALGYPAPKSFKKTQPRFTGQQLDTYVQNQRICKFGMRSFHQPDDTQ